MKRIFSILFALVLVLSFGLIPSALVEASPDPGLAGLWHLDEGTGITASDSSGNGNDGTLSGGKFGNALSFDGSDDYVEVAHDASLEPSEITIEAWIYPLSWDHTTTAVALATKRTAYGNGYFLFWYASTSTINFDWGGSSGANRWNTGYNPPLNTWTHLAVTRNSAGRALYVNGALYSSTTHVGAPANVPTTSALRVGYDSFAARYPFKGSIDEVCISNVARTSFDLTSPPSVDSNTVGLWHFDDGSGTIASDSSGNANDGTIYGASWVPAGPTWTTGKFGKALSFDGVDDYVKVPDSTSLEPSNITVEAWIKRLGSPGSNNYIVGKHYGSGWNSYALRAYSSGLQFYIGTTSIWYGSPVSGSVWDGNWHHVVGTFDGSYVRLYVDGSEVGMGTSVPVGTSIAYDGAGVNIGVPGDPWLGGPYHFGGKIDEVRIRDQAVNPVTVPLCAGQHMDVGTVTVWEDGTNLYVKYQTTGGWEMTETHLAVADNPGAFPTTKTGNPKVGHFPASMDHAPAVTMYTYSIPLPPGTPLYIAAHADLEKLGEVMTVTLASGTQTLPAGYTEIEPVSDPLNPSNYIPGTWSTAVDLSSPHPSWYNENLLPGAVWVSSADSPEGNTANNQWRLFKEEFEIPAGAIITSASLVMSADNSVEAYLNSTSVGTADDAVFGAAPEPPFSDPEDYHFRFLWGPFDLNPVEGTNTLMLVVRNWASEGDNPTGLIYKMDYEYQLLFSETAWGDGCEGTRFTERGNWATYFEYHVQ